ncbi:MAG: hypothetical protein RL441_1085 [Actinomycetota bacterium]|jgi:uncharacterized protein YbaR (Trm112 family)
MILTDLVAMLACPCDQHGELQVVDAGLKAACCGRIYPVVDGIPVLLMSEASAPKETKRGR